MPGRLHRGDQPRGHSQPAQGNRALHLRRPRGLRAVRPHHQQLLGRHPRARALGVSPQAHAGRAGRALHAHLLPGREARAHGRGPSRHARVVPGVARPPHRARPLPVRRLHPLQGAQGDARLLRLHHRRASPRESGRGVESGRLPRAHRRLHHRDGQRVRLHPQPRRAHQAAGCRPRARRGRPL